ncbi:MAG: hypothetical protein H8E21_08265 [Gammaproteobacteria bacterium]|nr:hypothetical protein [Gammaproteobacteria bacterium]MBL7001095.1 hypothetical protein [Gammaproteobacteria bacterium]
MIKPRFPALLLALWLYLPGAQVAADQQLDSLKYISAAGAPFLTLKMLDQAQPAMQKDLYEWILWEQERYQILARWKQWNDLLVRIEGLPLTLPEQFLQQAASYRIRAYIALGQNQTARQLLREQLWQANAASSSEYREWRKLVVETYLNEQKVDDARVSMLRLQQDFEQTDKDWILLRARVLMESGRFDETIALLSSRLDWQSLSMRLLAEYRNKMHSAKDLWELSQKRIAVIRDDPEQLATYWSISAIAAQQISPEFEVQALEARLSLAVADNINLYAVDADQLWQAYFHYAQLIGNRSELLIGDDQNWLQLAQNIKQESAVRARSLLAYLMTASPNQEVKHQAAELFLKTLNLENDQQKQLIDQLFNQSKQFSNAAEIPVQIRFQLVDLALKQANILEATRLMSGLDSVPEKIREFDWVLRQARVLLLGGKLKQGDDKLNELISRYAEPNKEDTDRLLQILFDLQTLQANEQAITHFRQLINLPIEPSQRREIMFWMADSFKALKQYEKAALLYLQSAMYPGPETMDPWAQTARFSAAESLQKAGLVDDARRVFQSLLEITREPARRSVLRHNIQQLWLTQGAG